MNQTFSRRFKNAALAVFAMIAVFVYWWYQDFRIRMMGDSRSVEWCHTNALGDPLSTYTSQNLLYAGYEIPYCSVVTATNVRVWLLIQIILWGLTTVLVYRAGALLFDELTGLTAGFSLALLWETFRFALRPQSDLLFICFLASVLWALAKWIETGELRWNLVAIGLMIALTLTRPFGFPILVGWVCWIVFRPGGSDGVDYHSVQKRLLVPLIGVLGSVVYLTYSHIQLTYAHTSPDVYWRKSLVATWANGIVVTHHQNPTFEYIYDPRRATNVVSWLIVNMDHLGSMALLKAAFFFVPVLPRWSTFHNLTNAVTLFPMIVGTFVGCVFLYRRRKYDQMGVLLTPILMTVMTVAVTFLDGGFNYRAPATLSFALVAAYALRELLGARNVLHELGERLARVDPTG